MSEERVSKWTNTIEATREKAIEEKKKALLENEAKLTALDKSEANIRNQQRKRIIERAKEIMFHNTEVAQKLASATLLSDVMKEREYQADVKASIEKERMQIDREFHDQLQLQIIKADKIEAEKNLSNKKAQKEVLEVLQSQIAATQQQKAAEKASEFDYGQRLRKQAKLAEQEEREKKASQELKRRENKRELQMFEENLKKLKLEESSKEKEFMQMMRERDRRKEDKQRLLQQKTKERRENRMRMKQIFIDAHARRIEDNAYDDDQKLKLVQKQMQEKELANESEKKKKQNALMQEVQSAIESQLEERRKSVEEQKAQTLRDLVAANEHAAAFEAEERERKKEQRQNARLLANFHRDQIVQKRNELQTNNPLRNSEALSELDRQDQDMKKFRAYAEKLVNAYENEGKSSKPLKVAMQHMKLVSPGSLAEKDEDGECSSIHSDERQSALFNN